jgi:hypothetical protein
LDASQELMIREALQRISEHYLHVRTSLLPDVEVVPGQMLDDGQDLLADRFGWLIRKDLHKAKKGTLGIDVP